MTNDELEAQRDRQTAEPLAFRVNDQLGACCGRCAHWNRAKKRNCSNPDTPVYYAACLYPLDEMRIPHCVTFEETYERNGASCPCFTAVDEAPNAELTGRAARRDPVVRV